MRTQARIGVAGAIGLSLLVAACGTQSPAAQESAGEESPAALRRVTIATGIDPTMVLPAAAKVNGIFEEHGLDVHVVQAPSGAAALEVMLSGNADMGLTVDIPGIRAAAQGGELRLLTQLSQSPGYVGIAASEGLSGLADLAGANVGYVKNASADYYIHRLLDDQGIAVDDVELIEMQPPELFAALQTGQVDAFVAWEPWLSRAEEEIQGAHVIARADDPVLYLNPVFAYVTPAVAEDMELAEALLLSFNEAADWLNSNPEEAASLAASQYSLEEELAANLLSKIDFEVSFRQESIDLYQDVANWMLENELVEQLPDWDQLFAPEAMRETFPDVTDYSG